MPTAKEQQEIEVLAAIHDGLGHPVRMAILMALRKEPELTSAALGHAVSASYTPVDARRLQFHVHKMQSAGIVESRKAGRGDVIRLIMDVTLRSKKL